MVSATESLHRFLGLPLALQPEYLVLYARRAGWFIGIRVMCPNHLTCCCLMCCRTGFAPAMSRITSFLILSRLVLFTAFFFFFFELTWVGYLPTHVNSKGKIPSTGGLEEGRTPDAASGRTASPTHYRLSYSSPMFMCERSEWQQHKDTNHVKSTTTGVRICVVNLFVCWLLACLTSQQHASVFQGRICSDNCTCCHTEIDGADQTFYPTQSQYTDIRPTSPSADPITPGAWQGSH